MIEIRPNQDFKHGMKTYKKGRKYQVTPEEARYFIAAGWVGEPTERTKDQTLNIDDINLGHSSEVN